MQTAGRVEFTVEEFPQRPVGEQIGLITESIYDAGHLEESIQYLSGQFNLTDASDESWKTAVSPEDILSTTFEYDNVGHQVLVTDALGHSTQTFYDELVKKRGHSTYSNK